MKKCSSCNTELPDFHFLFDGRGNLMDMCKKCYEESIQKYNKLSNDKNSRDDETLSLRRTDTHDSLALRMIEDLGDSFDRVSASVNNMNREIGAMQENITSLKESSLRQETTLYDMKNQMSTCPAKNKHEDTQKDLSKLKLSCGNVDMRLVSVEKKQKSLGHVSVFSTPILVRVAPWLIGLFIMGVAVGAAALTMTYNNKKDIVPKPIEELVTEVEILE